MNAPPFTQFDESGVSSLQMWAKEVSGLKGLRVIATNVDPKRYAHGDHSIDLHAWVLIKRDGSIRRRIMFNESWVFFQFLYVVRATLLHELGHILTNLDKRHRCTSTRSLCAKCEFDAHRWAIKKCSEMGLGMELSYLGAQAIEWGDLDSSLIGNQPYRLASKMLKRTGLI